MKFRTLISAAVGHTCWAPHGKDVILTQTDSTGFPTQAGYMTESAQRAYIEKAVRDGVLPDQAHRMADVISLTASPDPATPIQFWQLHSVLGHEPIVRIVTAFYTRVFNDEDWFTSVFARVGDIRHHINTQASMWVDVMGGGYYYHGADYRLNFHHYHNAHDLMNDKGAERWASLMRVTLDEAMTYLPDDPRIRPAINTFLDHFMGKYAADFGFGDHSIFGPTNPAYHRTINFRAMTDAAIEALSEDEIRKTLQDRGVDVSLYTSKAALIAKAQTL